jgi:hypothetical protein
VPILHESGKVGLQVAQLCKSGLGVTGTGDPLGELPPGAEGPDRSHALNSEAVAQQLDQIEHRALRIIELSAQYRQILSARERIGVAVAKDPSPSRPLAAEKRRTASVVMILAGTPAGLSTAIISAAQLARAD